MKKLTALYLSAISYLALAPSAFAQADFGVVDPCAEDSALNFSVLCDIGSGGVGSLVSTIITILFIIAILLALGFLIYGGIKWVVSGGDKAKVEAARGTIVAALVGLVLVFLSYFIINLISNFFGLGMFGGNFTIPSLNP